MKFALGQRKSIRYSIFIGVLVGSVFSGSGAFAGNISSVAELLAVTGSQDYVLTRSLDLSTEDANNSIEEVQLADVVTSGSLTYLTNGFTGILDGRGFTISGLTKPLFDTLSGEVNDLNLVTKP